VSHLESCGEPDSRWRRKGAWANLMLMSEFVVLSIDNLPSDRVSTTRLSRYVPCLFQALSGIS